MAWLGAGGAACRWRGAEGLALGRWRGGAGSGGRGGGLPVARRGRLGLGPVAGRGGQWGAGRAVGGGGAACRWRGAEGLALGRWRGGAGSGGRGGRLGWRASTLPQKTPIIAFFRLRNSLRQNHIKLFSKKVKKNT
jgi:hypothetical protein